MSVERFYSLSIYKQQDSPKFSTSTIKIRETFSAASLYNITFINLFRWLGEQGFKELIMCYVMIGFMFRAVAQKQHSHYH